MHKKITFKILKPVFEINGLEILMLNVSNTVFNTHYAYKI